jgi:two-component system sensor histidine kinase UhpB
MRDDISRDDGMRIEAIAANVPALVFQLQRQPDGSLCSLFTSKAVCTVCGEQINAGDAGRIPCISNLHPDDRDSFFSAMALSARQLTHWNWEGRIIVPPSEEKWINLRAVPCVMRDGSTVWDGIILNITLSKQREDESLHARFALEKLSDHIQRAREEERSKISREIHDELGGILSTLKMDLGWLAKRMNDPALLERTQAMAQLIGESLQTARRISADLRPGALDNLGLVAAMEEHAATLLGRQGIAYSFTPPEQEAELDDVRATAIFRIFQESLTNIVRHAKARTVEIHFALAPEELTISIRDDGCGMIQAQTQRPQSYGILGMQERAKQLGGELVVSGTPGHGTTVRLNLPLAVPEQISR